MAHKGAVRGGNSQGPAVRVFTLGRFFVEVDGEPVRFAAKTQRVPLLLLKALIAMGGESVPAMPITESLWPDSDGDAAYGTLGVTLRRLRILLKHDGTVTLRDGRLTLDTDRAWVDARAFSETMAAATKALLAGHSEEGEPLLDQALELYRGPFLDGEFEPNEIAAAREKLHGLFLRCMGQIGQYYLDSDEPGPAARLYQRGLEIDPEAEELYRGLMTCLQRQGRYAEALAVYGSCQAVLQGRWKIEPSPETEALRQEIAKASRQNRSAPPTPEPVAEVPAAEAPPAAQRGPAEVAALADSEGERKTATVVMLDLVGYTALTEILDPEELDTIMERVRTAANEVMTAHGGIVNLFVGDEVVGLFGVPRTQEDDPRRAVEAALAMHEEVAQIGEDVQKQTGRELKLHTGIATGLMLVRPSTGPEGAYNIMGAAIVTASRLERLAQAGEILLAPETHREVEAYFHTEPLRPVVPAGRDVALVPYRVVSPTLVATRFDAARQRGLTPYVAREPEMEVLQESLAASLRNEGRLVSVVGDAGIGKSRLLHEFRHGPGLEGITVLQGHCRPHGRKIPYQPFLDVLRQGLRLRTNEPAEGVSDKLAQRVEAISPALNAYVPHYLHMLSIHDPRRPLPAGLRGEALRMELERAIGAIITLNLEHRPMVVVMEDWHWCDEASDAVMRNLAGVISEYPLLVVVSYRPEYDAQWGNLPHQIVVQLGPLDDAHVERVIQATTGAGTVTPQLVARIQERTEGNPFFIEELCRALREQGGIVLDGDRAELAESTEQLNLPDSVQAIIRSRLDRLPQAARKVLRTAATIGGEFSGPVLARVLECAPAMPPELELLRQQELIQQVRIYPETVYRFNHAITHDVVYETLPLRTRERLHEQVGMAIEALYGERVEECYEALAHHFVNSTNRDKALQYLEKAGDKATRVHSLVEARKHYRSAVELLQQETPDEETRRRRCQITIKWAQVSFYSPTRDVTTALDVALNDAKALNDPALIARAKFWVGRSCYALGNHTDAMAQFQRCLDMTEAASPDVRALAMNYLGRSQVYMGRHAEAAETLTKSVPLLEQAGETAEVLNSMAVLVLNYGLVGQFDLVPPLVDRAFAMADQLQNPAVKGIGYLSTGIAWLLRGDWEPAREALIEAKGLAREMGNLILEGLAVWGHGYAEAHLGDTDSGTRLMTEGIATVESYESHLGLSAYYARLGEVYALLGKVRQAKAFANKALMVSRSGEKLGDDSAYCALAIAATKGPQADWTQAEAYIDKALDISRENGARSRLAVSLLRHAELLAERGENRRARSRLKEARALFKEMGMTWFDSQAAKLQSATRG